MRKNILFVLLIIIILVIGIVIGKTKVFEKQAVEEHKKAVIDSESVNAEIRLENKYPTYTVFGGPPDPKDQYRYIIARWYNFRFSVNGTSCTNIVDHSADVRHNNRTDSILQRRIGKNWRDLFENSVDSLYKVDSLAISITEKSILVKNAIKQKEKTNKAKYISYKTYPTTDKNLKIVSVEWYGMIYRDSTKVSFLRAIVDVKNKKVTQIEKAEREGNLFMF
ncbi:hypothetical protein [Flavobacterium foetidum]|uniref:hypothetical protein n=1 Tax=Flavobacterium foetidum TaxID=2026681 RepID=UPI0010750401|nr:hypothetical protein [Flavobacterium foetidum]KAF2513870.1 hypothetical protein E0W73_13665 [Flavobacterium foetidum]